MKFSKKEIYYSKKSEMEKRMKKNELENMEFREWFKEVWQLSGGLITNTTAARLLNKTSGRISQMVKEGKLREHRYNKEISYLETIQIFNMIHEETYNMLEDEYIKLSKKLPQEMKETFLAGNLKILKKQKNCMK